MHDTGFGVVFAVFVAIYIAIAVLAIIAWVKILQKAGYSGVWVLIALVPVANIVMFLVFAFSEWPTTRELKALRAQAGYGGYGPPHWPPPNAGPPPNPGPPTAW